MKAINFFIFGTLATLVACNSGTQEQGSLIIDDQALTTISKDSYIEHIKTLSSDEFEGRMPFTEGEEKTINYIKNQIHPIQGEHHG